MNDEITHSGLDLCIKAKKSPQHQSRAETETKLRQHTKGLC